MLSHFHTHMTSRVTRQTTALLRIRHGDKWAGTGAAILPWFLSPLPMATDQEEEDPLLYAEQAHERVYKTPFPWFQLSILFAVQTAKYLPAYATRTFIPDVWSS